MLNSQIPTPRSGTLPTTPGAVTLGGKESVTLFSHSELVVLMQLPLPGITIFVHGVNSDGEWYEEAEKGLCQGLNERLKRCDEHLKHCGTEAGQLKATGYMKELTGEGYINPRMTAKTYIQGDETFSPVIRFRWGYKANGEELQQFGKGLYLNEQNYWGGGPFANGCSSLPDLWGQGLIDRLFLFMHVQHLNPAPDRQVFSCPPRPYYVLAAWRLAKLVESIRRQQADVPITIVCHSQGNMVGMAAAFLGDALAQVTDAAGKSGRCVADTYVLCNPPYSVLDKNGAEGWTQRSSHDAQERSGRETGQARQQTLAAFFEIVRGQAGLQQPATQVDERMANRGHGFTADKDRADYGLNGCTYGRVTLYCNPHDQVISASAVQGMGWRGLSKDEIKATQGEGVFTQRVFAQGFKVGEEGKTQYHYWADHYQKPKEGSQKFWHPESPKARYQLHKGTDANPTLIGKVATVLAGAVMVPVFGLVNLLSNALRINALPPEDWKIPLKAPKLPEAFLPQAVKLGQASEKFDQDYDPPGSYRDKEAAREEGDPYAGEHQSKKGHSDKAQGSEDSEASLRYEDHALLRMRARRELDRYKNADTIEEEDNLKKASPDYQAWRHEKLQANLAKNIDAHATDHSTIMTNPMHAQKALAYDVAVGVCNIQTPQMHELRVAADWRFLDGLKPDDPNKEFFEYFDVGKVATGKTTYQWANAKNSPAKMPTKIVDERTNQAPKDDLYQQP
jgi:pimeloyl-ACP methyl ester carboxylesterase